MNLVDELFAVTAALREGGVRHAICGGIAVTIHGATRTTKDIDLLVEASDVERALGLLRPLGYTFAALPMTFEAGTSRERRVQRVSKLEDGEHLCVDLLLAQAAFANALDDVVELDLDGVLLPVVSREILLAMKRMAGRDQDLADLRRLEDSDG